MNHNPVFDVLLRLGKARLARAKAPKPPRRDKLDKKSMDLLLLAVWLLERLKGQPELAQNDPTSFGACAAVIGHFAPFSELPLAHGEVASRGGNVSAKVQAPKAKARHTLVLRLMREIEAANCTLPKDEVATRIEARLPSDKALGRSQILKIMRNSKKAVN